MGIVAWVQRASSPGQSQLETGAGAGSRWGPLSVREAVEHSGQSMAFGIR